MKQRAQVEDYDFDELDAGVGEAMEEKGEAMDIVRDAKNEGDQRRHPKWKRVRSSLGSTAEAYAAGNKEDKGEGSSQELCR